MQARDGGPGGSEGTLLTRLQRWVPALAALEDDLRRALYLFVRSQGRAVTRDEAAEHCGVSGRLAAFHLDKLVRKGLLQAHYRRKPGRSGPGAGRSSKFYSPSDIELDVTIPERRYDLVGEILLAAVAADGEPRAAALGIARERGRALGRAALEGAGPNHGLAAASDVLGSLGFEPYEGEAGLSLRSCPFHALARRDPELVCGINRAFIEGLVAVIGDDSLVPSMEPTPEECCVKIRAATA